MLSLTTSWCCTTWLCIRCHQPAPHCYEGGCHAAVCHVSCSVGCVCAKTSPSLQCTDNTTALTYIWNEEVTQAVRDGVHEAPWFSMKLRAVKKLDARKHKMIPSRCRFRTSISKATAKQMYFSVAIMSTQCRFQPCLKSFSRGCCSCTKTCIFYL